MDPEVRHWTVAEILSELEGARVFARDDACGLRPMPEVLGLAEPDQLERSDLVATRGTYAAAGVHGFGICHADQALAVQTFVAALSEPGRPVRAKLRSDAGSEWRNVEATVLDLRHQPEVGVVLVGIRDLGPCEEPEMRSRRRDDSSDDDSDEASFDSPSWFLFELDSLGIVQKVDGDFEDMLGRPRSEIVGIEVLQFVHPDDHVAGLEMWVGLLEEPGSSRTMRQRVLGPDGSVRWVDSTVLSRLDEAGSGTVLILSHDATERRRMERDLHRRAMSDPLTGMPNRFALETRLAELLLEGSATVAFMDLDGFKGVNDELGHVAGDQVLEVIGRRLGASVGAHDDGSEVLAGRWGGDEFVLIGAGDCEDLLRSAIDEAFADPVSVGGQTWHPRCSYGTAHGTDATDPEALVRSADNAMYGAKELRVR